MPDHSRPPTRTQTDAAGTRDTGMTTETTSVSIADGIMTIKIVSPDIGEGPWPAVVVCMDAGGIRPAMLAVARRLADAGYVAVLPDLYHRHGPYGPLVPAEVFAGDVMAVLGPLMATTDNLRAAEDIGAMVDVLAKRDDVAADRFGVVGFCMGGGMALAAAARRPEHFAAVATFHGGGLATDEATSPHLLVGDLAAEAYVAAATDDPHYPAAMARRFETSLEEAGVRYVVETYPAGHGWMVEDMPTHDPEQAERGWRAMLDLFARTLSA